MKSTNKLAEVTKRVVKGWFQELSRRLRNHWASERPKFTKRLSQVWKPVHFQTMNANKLARPQVRANFSASAIGAWRGRPPLGVPQLRLPPDKSGVRQFHFGEQGGVLFSHELGHQNDFRANGAMLHVGAQGRITRLRPVPTLKHFSNGLFSFALGNFHLFAPDTAGCSRPAWSFTSCHLL